jgi:UrcA family protein
MYLLILAATLLGASAAADPVVPRATVSTAGLDLSRAEDVRALNRRVARATEKVCGSYAGARDGEEERVAACRADVARQLAPQLAVLKSRGQVARR